jgi:hypothetical protein
LLEDRLHLGNKNKTRFILYFTRFALSLQHNMVIHSNMRRLFLIALIFMMAAGCISAQETDTTLTRHTHPIPLKQRLLEGLPKTTDDVMEKVQDGMLIRAGRKATTARAQKAGDKRQGKYLFHLSPDSSHAGPIATSIRTETAGPATQIS